MLKIIGSVYSDTGQVRQQNEDNLYWQGQFRRAFELAGTLKRNFNSDDSVQLYAISDGMGGLARGELASRIAVSDLPALDQSLHQGKAEEDSRKLDYYLRSCNNYIWERNQKTENLDEAMGATISLLLLRDSNATLVNMGDTAVYHFHDGLMKQVSRDDSHAARLRSLGYLTREEAKSHPFKNSLVNYLGKVSPEEELRYFLVPDIMLHAGDLLLLCSDGISGVLSRDIIAEVLADEQSVEGKVSSLVDLAVASGSADNITAILLRVVTASNGQSQLSRGQAYAARPIEGEDLQVYDPHQTAKESVPDVTRRIIPAEETTVFRPVKPEQLKEAQTDAAVSPTGTVVPPTGATAPPPVRPPVMAPGASPLPVKPVRVFAEQAEEGIQTWPQPAKKQSSGDLSSEQMAYYTRAREEAIRRQAQRQVTQEKQAAMRPPEKKPMSGEYSRPAAVPPAQTYARPQTVRPSAEPLPAHESAGQAVAGQAVPQRPLSREEKARIYDMRYQDSDKKQAAAQNVYPSSQAQAQGGKKGNAFLAFLHWLIFFLIFIILGFGIMWFLIHGLPHILP